MFVFIALGMLLPLMHQSSFGTVILAVGTKLSPLWLTVWLPLLFVTNAILMGYSIVMLEAAVVTHSLRPALRAQAPVPPVALRRLAHRRLAGASAGPT